MSEPVLSLDVRALSDLTTVLATLTPSNANWQDPAQDVGSGQVVVQNDLAPAALDTDSAIVASFDGSPEFTLIVEQLDKVLVTIEEEAGEVTVATCRMLRSILDRAAVRPTSGFDRNPFGDTRTFSFASPEFVTDGAWVVPTVIVTNVLTDSTYYTGTPAGFWGVAEPWIGPSSGTQSQAPLGYWYGVYDFTLAADTDVVFGFGVDDRASLFIDGFLLAAIAPGSDPTSGYRVTTSATVRLSAGSHRLAWKVVNDFGHADPGFGVGATIAGNPTALCYTAWSIEAGRLTGRLFGSADYAGARILEYPAAAPGMSVHQVASIVLAENQADGILTGVTLDGSNTLDSNGNAWPVYEFITADVGRSLLALLMEWSQTYCDFDLYGPTSLRLFMWRWHERGGAVGVTYSVANQNLDKLVKRDLAPVTDALMVRWSKGWTRVPSSGGGRVGILQVGGAESVHEATTLAGKQVAVQGVEQTMYLADIAPHGVGDVPYRDFRHADLVTVAGVTERVVQIDGTLSSDVLLLTTRTRERIFDVQDQIANAIARLSLGTLGGSALPASPADPPAPFVTKVSEHEVTFQVLDPPIVSVSPDKRLSSSANLYAVAITATTAGATSTFFEFLVDGVDVLSGLGILPAGSKFALIPLLIAGSYVTVWCEGNKSRLAVSLTSIGGVSCSYPTGPTGLLIEPRFV